MQVLSEIDLLMLDTTTDNVSTAKHGFVPKAPNDSSKVLLGNATWGDPPGGGGGGGVSKGFVIAMATGL